MSKVIIRYNDPTSGSDLAKGIAVAPAGGTFFVTGEVSGPGGSDYGTVAYDRIAPGSSGGM